MTPSNGPSQGTIDLTYSSDSDAKFNSSNSGRAISDEDDSELNKAIALSLQSISTPSPPATTATEEATQAELCCGGIVSDSSRTLGLKGLVGMDRKKDEEARLARLKRKRGHNVSPPRLSNQKISPTTLSTDLRTQEIIPAAQINPSISAQADQINSPPSHKQSPRLEYPRGVIKKTWAFGFERKEDIKIEEVLRPSQLEAAVLSAFQWDWDWLLPKMDTRRTKFVFVVQAKDEQVKQGYRADFDGIPNVRLCFPSMQGQINCMHSKLMLLFYPTHLRIAVPSANLVPYDWGEAIGADPKAVMENAVFLIDLPKSSNETPATTNADIPFFQSLLGFIEAMGLPGDVIKKVKTFDFTNVAEHGFVHTIGGAHHGDAWKKTGLCGLGAFLNTIGLRTTNSLHIDYVTSSLGNVNDEFLRALYLVAQGDSGLSEYILRTGKAIPPGILKDLQQRVGADFESGCWRDNFRIYFPSEQTVHNSIGGPACAEPICFQSRWWEGAKFPRLLLRDCRSRREGLLMHNKVCISRLHERPGNVGRLTIFVSSGRSGTRNIQSQCP